MATQNTQFYGYKMKQKNTITSEYKKCNSKMQSAETETKQLPLTHKYMAALPFLAWSRTDTAIINTQQGLIICYGPKQHDEVEQVSPKIANPQI